MQDPLRFPMLSKLTKLFPVETALSSNGVVLICAAVDERTSSPRTVSATLVSFVSGDRSISLVSDDESDSLVLDECFVLVFGKCKQGINGIRN